MFLTPPAFKVHFCCFFIQKRLFQHPKRFKYIFLPGLVAYSGLCPGLFPCFFLCSSYLFLTWYSLIHFAARLQCRFRQRIVSRHVSGMYIVVLSAQGPVNAVFGQGVTPIGVRMFGGSLSCQVWLDFCFFQNHKVSQSETLRFCKKKAANCKASLCEAL